MSPWKQCKWIRCSGLYTPSMMDKRHICTSLPCISPSAPHTVYDRNMAFFKETEDSFK
ncbi:hypothetical protein DPMN_087788 [Dreissena polymorpha]|uniref:Uncharacterized protein n=1 Tax=Dreissena polymorpha TaxID=45954 RepID=A0A9D4QWP8_DREPO|nr:hypothetical protein DPMN_087788 [Dreissena polymorpha]